MNFIKKNWIGILVCFIIAVPSWLIGKRFPVVGGPIIAILAGMLIALVWTDKGKAEAGIKWTSKIVLQTAVVLLGFGMNLGVILQTGKQSLPIIICTIGTSLLIAWVLRKVMKVPANTSILVGVGSSICGGSAIAATAPVIPYCHSSKQAYFIFPFINRKTADLGTIQFYRQPWLHRVVISIYFQPQFTASI